MANLELKTNAPGLDKVINDLGKMSKAEQKVALSAVGMGKALDNSTRKGKKNVSALDKGLGKMKGTLLSLAGPGAIFAGFFAKAKLDFDHIIKMADKAKNQNAGFAASQSDLFTNDRLFRKNKGLQKDFDTFFKDQGKRSEGLVNALPAAVAGARSKTAALSITQDPAFLKAATKGAANAYVGTQGRSNLEGDIVSIAQIADRDKRDVTAQQKAISAEAQKAQFQGQSATDAGSASAIIPKLLSSFVNFGSKEELLASQSFATNQGLTQEAALSGLSQIDTKLAKHKKFKKFKGTGFERMQEAGRMLSSGELNINEFAGGEKPIINAIAQNGGGLNTFVKELKQAQGATKSASLDNLQAQIQLNPGLGGIINERAARGSAEVSALQNIGGSDFSATRGTGQANLEASGASGSKIFATDQTATVAKFAGNDNKAIEQIYEFGKLQELSGRGTLDYFNPFSDAANNPEGRAKLAAEARSGTLSGKLVNASGGFDAQEQARLRFVGADEGQISELNRIQKEDNKKAQELLQALLEELKKANEQRDKANSDRKQLVNKPKPGEDDAR